jgi:hypothetical protein
MCSSSGLFEYNKACSYGSDAALKQIGADEVVGKWEKKETKSVEKTVIKYVGKKNTETILTTALLMDMAIKKSATVSIGKGPLDGMYAVETGTKDFKINIRWDF